MSVAPAAPITPVRLLATLKSGTGVLSVLEPFSPVASAVDPSIAAPVVAVLEMAVVPAPLKVPSTRTASPGLALTVSGLMRREATTAPRPPSADARMARRERGADGSTDMISWFLPVVASTGIHRRPRATSVQYDLR